MPRETIPTASPAETFEAVVTWTPSLHLQVGIETVGGYHLLDALTSRTRGEDPEAEPGEHGPMHRIGQAVEAVVLDYQRHKDGSYTELGGIILDAITGNLEGFTGLYVTLERPGAQKFLRSLKRARNAVFGADE